MRLKSKKPNATNLLVLVNNRHCVVMLKRWIVLFTGKNNIIVILQIRKLRLRETDTIAYPLNRDLSSGLVIHLPNKLDLISNTIITVLP